MNNMDEMTLVEVSLWRGWYRAARRHRWRLVAEGTNEQEVHDLMLDVIHASGDFVMTQGQRDPNEEKK